MPVPLRANHRAEAKYNVTTEFPSLGLHSAAANGNVGLVEYALSRGQPINSVVDGVLPLHAACAGGSEQVVELLIRNGADVNAPRLPRRYFNEKSRDGTRPIVGTSGSTPLHFAAANGNTAIVRTLLLRGAHPDRPDKHGIIPETLARQHGWLECAELLRDWLANKDKDLQEREDRLGTVDERPRHALNSYASRERFSADSDSGPTRRRIQMKRSIDNALNMLKGSSSNLSEAYLRPIHTSTSSATAIANATNPAFTPPASPIRPLGEYTFYAVSPSDDSHQPRSPADPNARRPSLPHVLQPPQSPRHRRGSNTNTSPHQKSSSGSPRRPRSAGTGAEQQSLSTPSAAGFGSNGRKLGSKYSLMNLFRKGQSSDSPEPGLSSTGSISSTFLSSSPSQSPATGSSSALNLSSSGIAHTQSQGGQVIHSSPPDAHEFSFAPSTSPRRTGFRFRMGSDTSMRSRATRDRSASGSKQQSPLQSHIQQSQPRRPHQQPPVFTSAVDMHNALAHEQQTHRHQNRDRSASVGRPIPVPIQRSHDDSGSGSPAGSPGGGSAGGSPSPLSRLGMLRPRGHRRDRSGSASGDSNRNATVYDDELLVASSVPTAPGSRPSILRGHSRSSSGGGSSASGGFRALRFDPHAYEGVNVSYGSPHAGSLRSANSVGSLGKSQETLSAVPIPDSTRPRAEDLSASESIMHIDEEDDVEDYGQPLSPPSQTFNRLLQPPSPATPAIDLQGAEEAPGRNLRERGLSFGSSSDGSMSPVGAAAGINTLVMDHDDDVNDFPFSISHPPPLMSDTARDTGDGDEHLRVPAGTQSRGRGDSVSSTSTADSLQDGPALSASGSTPGSAGITVMTPFGPSAGYPQVYVEGEDANPLDAVGILPVGDDEHEKQEETRTAPPRPLLQQTPERRSRTPIEHIDISSISTHAQAEALVQRAQQDILDMTGDLVLNESGTAFSGTSRTPLSARLAAYGETLALERRLREQKERQETVPSRPEEAQSTGGSPRDITPLRRSDGIERQASLGQRTGSGPIRTKAKVPRRPHTSSGTSQGDGTDVPNAFAMTHQSSQSASAAVGMDADISGPEELASHALSSAEPSASLATPDTGELSDIYPSESDDTGSELYRVSTAPSITTRAPASYRRDPSRPMGNDTKLRRMGFDVAARQQQQPSSATPKRFGGLKSLMQTLKGRQ